MTDTNAREPPGGTAPLSEANPFRLLPFKSKRFPFGASIRWTPRRSWVIDERLMPRPDIVIDQTVFETIKELRAAHPAGEAAGVLVGNLCECPWTRRHWVHAMAAAGATLPVGVQYDGEARAEDAHGGNRVIENAVMAVVGGPDAGDAVPVGWFRARHGSGCSLRKAEADLHARHFTEPWQFGMRIGSSAENSDARHGAVFVSDESGGLTGRHWSFYERFEGITELESGPVPSGVMWSNYTSDRPTVAPSARRQAPRASRRGRAGPSVPARKPGRPGRRRGATVLAASAVIAIAYWQVFSGNPPASADLAPSVPADEPGLFTSPILALAPAALEEFRKASRDYFDVSRAFLAQEVGCARLATAYRSANDALAALGPALRYEAKPDGGSDGVTAETVREIEASFARSGCGTS